MHTREAYVGHPSCKRATVRLVPEMDLWTLSILGTDTKRVLI